MRTARALALGLVLLGAWALSRGQIAKRQPWPLLRKTPLSERLGLLDDHLAEWS